MKKLLEETTDDLTRALLVAGSSHRPPAGNKGKLLVALGAGTSVGLLSSKAFAWLSTSTGKLSLIGVVGVAGALYVVTPLLKAEPPALPRVELEANTPAALEEGGEDRFAGPPSGAGAPGSAPRVALMPLAAPPAPEARTAQDVPAPATEERRVVAPERKAAAKRSASRARALERGLSQAVSPLSPEAPAPAGGAEVPTVQSGERSRLEAEVQLVDDMHWAARRNDRDALTRFVETYRQQFPEGQLREEVAEFAARLERP